MDGGYEEHTLVKLSAFFSINDYFYFVMKKRKSLTSFSVQLVIFQKAQ